MFIEEHPQRKATRNRAIPFVAPGRRIDGTSIMKSRQHRHARREQMPRDPDDDIICLDEDYATASRVIALPFSDERTGVVAQISAEITPQAVGRPPMSRSATFLVRPSAWRSVAWRCHGDSRTQNQMPRRSIWRSVSAGTSVSRAGHRWHLLATGVRQPPRISGTVLPPQSRFPATPLRRQPLRWCSLALVFPGSAYGHSPPRRDITPLAGSRWQQPQTPVDRDAGSTAGLRGDHAGHNTPARSTREPGPSLSKRGRRSRGLNARSIRPLPVDVDAAWATPIRLRAVIRRRRHRVHPRTSNKLATIPSGNACGGARTRDRSHRRSDGRTHGDGASSAQLQRRPRRDVRYGLSQIETERATVPVAAGIEPRS